MGCRIRREVDGGSIGMGDFSVSFERAGACAGPVGPCYTVFVPSVHLLTSMVDGVRVTQEVEDVVNLGYQ